MVSVLEGHEYDLFTARAASCPRQFSGLFNIDLEHILLETLNDYNTLRQVVNLTWTQCIGKCKGSDMADAAFVV